MKKSFVLAVGLFFCGTLSTYAQVNYATQIQPIFNSNCTSCHGGTSGVRLNTYANVMSSVGDQYQTNIVNPRNAAASPLVNKLKPNPTFGSRMPNTNGISSNSIQLIETWINEGANEMPTSIEDEIAAPQSFTLLGNFPNPFNPSTTISFQLGGRSVVQLQVFDVNGKEILKQAKSFGVGQGNFVIQLSGQASGLYMYRLSAVDVNNGVSVLSGKMILMK